MTTFYNAKSEKVKLPKGKKIFWRLSAYGILIKNQKILLVNTPWDNRWQLPGGKIEINESLPDGLAREYLEETGYKIDRKKITIFYSGESYFFDNILTKKYYHSVNLFFNIELMDDYQNKDLINQNCEVKNEIKIVAWIDLSSLDENNCHPLIFPVIKKSQKT